MPKPGDDATVRLVATTYGLLQQHLRWPTFAELDVEYDQFDGLEAADVLRRASDGLFYGSGAGSAAPPDNQQIGLTLAGLSACPGSLASEDVSAFVATMRHAADTWDAEKRSDRVATISSETLANFVPLPAAGRRDQTERLGQILAAENWGYSSWHVSPEGVWTFEIGRHIRRLRQVVDAADYWRRVHERSEPGVKTPKSTGPNSDQASRVRAWIELHAEPPRLVVANTSEAEIRDVIPFPALVSRDSAGNPSTFLGGSSLGRVSELSPGGAVIVSLPHYAAASRRFGVETGLHVEFDDARGQRWRVGHGQIIAIQAPHGPPAQLSDGSLVSTMELDLSEPADALASATEDRVAFLSYVHENSAEVDLLQQELEAAGITVWRDRDQLLPGDNIKTAISQVIRDRSFAFISCFSAERAQRPRTMANRELAAAVDALQDQTTSSWFIPVALDPHPLPEVSLGPIHGQLGDILRANLFGSDRSFELEKLCRALLRLT